MTTPISNNPLTPRPGVNPVTGAPGAPSAPDSVADPAAPQGATGPVGDSSAVGGSRAASQFALNAATEQWAELVWTPKTDLELPPQVTENTAQWAETILTETFAPEIEQPPEDPGEEVVLTEQPPLPAAIEPPPAAPAAEAAPPVVRMASVSVGGSGMGASSSKTLTMTEDELIAVYSVFKQKNGAVRFEELAAILKEQYGIDAEVKRGENGLLSIVNRETGNVIAADSNGDGMLTTHDMGFEQALTDLGIDPGSISGAGRGDGLGMAAAIAQDALDAAEKMEARRKADMEASKAIESAAATKGLQMEWRTGGPQSGDSQAPAGDGAPAATGGSSGAPASGSSAPATRTPSV